MTNREESSTGSKVPTRRDVIDSFQNVRRLDAAEHTATVGWRWPDSDKGHRFSGATLPARDRRRAALQAFTLHVI